MLTFARQFLSVSAAKQLR